MRMWLVLLLAAGAAAQAPGDRVISSDAVVDAVSFQPDGRVLVGVCRDGKARLWNARSGTLERTIAWDQGDAAAGLPANLGLLGTAGHGAIKVWDLSAGQVARRIDGAPGPIRRLAFSRDGKLIAGSSLAAPNSSEYTMRVWDASGKQLIAVPAGLGGTSAMAFSTDGSILAAGSYDTNLRVWRVHDGELVRLLEDLPVSMFALAFSPDGRYLAAAGADRTVYLFNAKSFELERKFVGQPEMISALAFSPDSRTLLTGGFSELTEKHPVKILLWDTASGAVLRTMSSAHIVRSVAFSPDGKLAASTNLGKSVDLWAMPPAPAR